MSNRADANQPLPDYWAKRDYVDPAIAGPLNTSIDWFAGRVTYKGGDNKYHFSATALFSGTPTIKTNTVQSSFTYHAAIDQTFSGALTLPGVSAKPSKDFSYDYEITDIANVIVPDANVPTRAAVAASLPAGFPATTAVWWVSVVGLSTVRIEQGEKLGFTGTITGSGFGINGDTMNTTNIATYVPQTSILVSPMNAAADAVVAAAPAPPTPPAGTSTNPVLVNLPAASHILAALGSTPNPRWNAYLDHNSSGAVESVVGP